MGSEQPIDNGELCWKDAQSILPNARSDIGDIAAEAGPSTLELRSFNNYHHFPMFRLLRLDLFYPIFCQRIAKGFLYTNQIGFQSVKRTVLIQYLTEKRPGEWIQNEAKPITHVNTSIG